MDPLPTESAPITPASPEAPAPVAPAAADQTQLVSALTLAHQKRGELAKLHAAASAEAEKLRLALSSADVELGKAEATLKSFFAKL
ncbi:MAG: hypothetical protein ABSF29_12860 [Tepidisphaeraceae bacterium]|jgi:hypothetical protein